MTDMSDEELRQREGWDESKAQELAPLQRRSRAVVSVAFGAEDIDAVVEAARTTGMKLSQFIRAAALQKAAALPTHVSGFTPGGPRTESVGYSEHVGAQETRGRVAIAW